MAETEAVVLDFWRKLWLPWWLFVRDVAAHVSTDTQRNATTTRRLNFLDYEQSENSNKVSLSPDVTTEPVLYLSCWEFVLSTNLLDCSGSVKPHPVLNFRGLQHESVRHVHAQHSHHFRKTPFFPTKHMKRARKHRLWAGLIFSARCVCKSQSSLVFHVTVCTWERHCVPIGCWPYGERVSALWLVESLRTSS